jgi:hypothetical protein
VSEREHTSSAATGLAGLGVVAFAVACCAGPALILGAVGGITLGVAIGGLAGLAVIVGSVASLALVRRRRSCGPSVGGVPPQTETAASAAPESNLDS